MLLPRTVPADQIDPLDTVRGNGPDTERLPVHRQSPLGHHSGQPLTLKLDEGSMNIRLGQITGTTQLLGGHPVLVGPEERQENGPLRLSEALNAIPAAHRATTLRGVV